MPNLASATDSQKAAVATHVASRVAAGCVKFWTAQGQLYSASDNFTTTGKSEDGIRQDAAKRRQELIRHQMPRATG